MAEKTTKEESKEEKTIVVRELPQQSVNTAEDDKGNKFNLLTTEEALTIILEKVTKIEKSVA
jgi:hypothetical protein